MSLSRYLYSGEVSLYFFPHRIGSKYPGSESRLGIGVDVDENEVWSDGKNFEDDTFAPQYGFRITQFFFGIDISFHYLHHWDRRHPVIGNSEYSLSPNGILLPDDGTINTPYYFEVDQWALTLQKAWEGFVFKFEGTRRSYLEHSSILTASGLRSLNNHTNTVAGLEYGWTHPSGSESSYIIEAQKIWGLNSRDRAELETFQNDVLLAYRYAFNDIWGQEIFFSIIHDLERDDERLYNLSYSTRLDDYWKIRSGLRYYEAPQKGDLPVGLEILDEDHHAHLTLTRFF